jgi:thiol-disulfide isomerase/thioredoxin
MKNFYKHDLPMLTIDQETKILKLRDFAQSNPNIPSTSNNHRDNLIEIRQLDSYLKYLSSEIYELQLKKYYGDIILLAKTFTLRKNSKSEILHPKSRNIKTIKHKTLINSLPLIPLLLTFFLCLASLSHTLAQDTIPNSQVYKLGQIIPMEIWEKPLNLFNHPTGKQVSQLKEYSEKKLIIIDFWSTWCGTCLFTMPRTYDKLSPYTNSIELIPVTTQSIQTIYPTWKNSEYLQSIPNFYSVVDEHTLKQLFGIPHYPIAIIINRKGQILFYDKPSKITDELLHNLLDKETAI